jgi:hypothetical protein
MIGTTFAWVWRRWHACLLIGVVALFLSFAAIAALAGEIGNIFHDPCAGGTVPNCDESSGSLEGLYLLLAIGFFGLAGTLLVRGPVLLVQGALRRAPAAGWQRTLVKFGVAVMLALGACALYTLGFGLPF